MESSFKLGRVAGIEVGIHYTWIVAFVLVSWSLAQGFFPGTYPGWTPAGVGTGEEALRQRPGHEHKGHDPGVVDADLDAGHPPELEGAFHMPRPSFGPCLPTPIHAP